jgi:hypothetical protein
MGLPDLRAPLSLLHAGYQPDDWVAIFLKSYETGETAQRVGPLSWVSSARFQAWLRSRNAARWNIYVSVNALTPARRSRARDAVQAVRHVFLEADHDGSGVLASIAARTDLPPPSYLVHSSPNRVHVLWRVTGFDVELVEALQKQLARELGTDVAATSCTQTTRLPGFRNHKYDPAPTVTIAYGCLKRLYTPTDFPRPLMRQSMPGRGDTCTSSARTRVQRARRYLATMPAAVAGHHGDVHTFRVCCRMVRGFALDDDEAMALLTDWNARCDPPWTSRELADKVLRARRYGREPIGELLEGRT